MGTFGIAHGAAFAAVIGPVMMGRDHHDTGGTDSPFRETANIKDGSNIMADMAVHCFAGNAARGMSLVALHNGGGVGIGKAAVMPFHRWLPAASVY